MLKFSFFTLLLSMALLRLALTATLEYPAESLVRLKSVHGDNYIRHTDMYCTGTILNPAYLLTHARCFEMYNGHGMNISIAFINTLVGDEAKTSNVRNVVWHNHGLRENGSSDLNMALVELVDSHVEFSDYVHPAVLYFGDVAVVKQFLGVHECVVMGWTGVGFQVYISYFVHTLTISNVTIVGDDVCKQEYPDMQEIICARTKDDLCDLELGSPLVCGTEGKWLFLGYYTGLNGCESPSKSYAFQKLGVAWEWLNTTAKGIYYLTSETLLGSGSLRSNSPATITMVTIKLLLLATCPLLVS